MEFKHFSHPHGLCFHQMSEGAETHCSGCNSSASGAVYTCWQCNFFLHEQCFRAARSLNHPSHPPHPLSLLPNPTYPSASFVCNSCNVTGTGFSYSCSSCEFDLHVHCAYLPPTQSTFPNPNANYSLHHETQIPNPHYMYPPEITTAHESVLNGENQFHSYSNQTPGFNPQFGFVPEAKPHEPVVNSHHQQYNLANEGMPSFNPPAASAAEAPSPAKQPPHALYSGENQYNSFSHQAPAYNTHFGHAPEAKPHESTVNIPDLQHSPSDQAVAGANTRVSLSSEAMSAANRPNHVPFTGAFANQALPKIATPAPVVQSPKANQAPSTPSAPAAAPAVGETQLPPPPPPPRNMKHFSHHHALQLSEVHEDDYVLCSGCEQHLSGSCYSCIKPRCQFNLHVACFELPREHHHKSHPNHSLTLLSSPPDKDAGEFTCNACLRAGAGFAYHCESCKFSLHVKCATLPETMKREFHEHALTLLYSSPYKKMKQSNNEELVFYCDVCQDKIDENCWVYYCEECDFGTDLHCGTSEEGTEEEGRGGGEEMSAEAIQLRMQRLQMQMQMAQQSAQLMINLGQSLSNLA